MNVNVFTGGSPLALLGLLLLSLGLQTTTVSAELQDAYKAFDRRYLPEMKKQMIETMRKVAEHERSTVESNSAMGANDVVFNKRSDSSQIEESIEAMKSASSELLGQFRVLGHGIIKEQFPMLTSSEVSKEESATLFNKKLEASWKELLNKELGDSVQKRNVLTKRSGLGQSLKEFFFGLKGARSAPKAGTAKTSGNFGNKLKYAGSKTGRFFSRVGRGFVEFFKIKIIFYTLMVFVIIGLALFVVDMAKKGSPTAKSAIKPPTTMADDEIRSSSEGLDLDDEE